MIETAEIRWFIKGEMPKEVFAWFDGYDDFPASTQTRTDHYLRLPGTMIGIKIREGLIEHKQKGDGVGEFWGDGVCSGNMEQWQKWSFPLNDDTAIAEMLSTYPESWLEITNERSLRILILDKEGYVKSTSYEEVSGTAVGWELTKITIEGVGKSWWTIGFESFGRDNELKETLIRVCNTILTDCPLALVEENCYSYPELFKRVL